MFKLFLIHHLRIQSERYKDYGFDFDLIINNKDDYSDQQSVSEGKQESSILINVSIVETSSSTFKLI
jgi:hypothetical protein